MRFQREIIGLDFFQEALPLFVDHHREVSFFRKDSALTIDYSAYLSLEEQGLLRVFTARDEDGTLKGYCAFSLSSHLHYANVLMASQTAIYIPQKSRGFGCGFIKWCNSMLQSEGITHVIHRVTKECDFSPILIRDGFQFLEASYIKDLGVA